MKKYTNDEKARIVKDIDSCREKGEFIAAAAKAAGIVTSQYYKWRNQYSVSTHTARAARKKEVKTKVKSMTVNLPSSDTMMLVIGNASDVRFALERLAQIQGA